jgi:hypothetical protein
MRRPSGTLRMIARDLKLTEAADPTLPVSVADHPLTFLPRGSRWLYLNQALSTAPSVSS